MPTLDEAFSAAVAHHQAGRLPEAEQIYRQILAAAPNHSDCRHLLGVLAHQAGHLGAAEELIRQAIALSPTAGPYHLSLGSLLVERGRADEAIACYSEALRLKPDHADAHLNLGTALAKQGRTDEAVACFRQVLQLQPDYAGAYFNLATLLKGQGKLDDAISNYQQALRLNPNYPQAHLNLGTAFAGQCNWDQATACYRRALELKPDYAEAQLNLGNVFQEQKNPSEASAWYRRVLELKPDYVEAHYNLGIALAARGELGEAATCFRRALELKPDDARARGNLGVVLTESGELDEAITCFRRALELKPDNASVRGNLGVALADRGQLEDAAACFRQVLELTPDNAEAHNNLGFVFKERGQLDDAVACFRRALDLKPDYAEAHSNLLYALHYRAGVSLSELTEAHAEYDRLHAAPLLGAARLHKNNRDPHRQLRLGFVSPDFRNHPVGFLLIRLLENLDPQQCETICYSNKRIEDGLTARFRDASALWQNVVGLNDEQLAEKIEADGIDILFDLSGHTSGNRLLMFARKPAPIQISWIGYEGTTGLAAMDYLLADRYVLPHESEVFYREKILQMPHGYICYDPPAAAPPVGSLPALERGAVTFGSFNSLAKITAEVIATWAKILTRVPRSRLLLKRHGLNDQSIRERLFGDFAKAGIDPRRLDLQGPNSYADYLATYHEVDIVLDAFPFSGSATTCEALWMGVPVITCPSETFASRHGLSHMSNIGLTETIAGNLDEYVDLAVSWASDLPRLAQLRAGLRSRMETSPLCDGPRFAADMMTVLRDVWRQWCEGSGVAARESGG